MWIDRETYKTLNGLISNAQEAIKREPAVVARALAIEAENVRLRADLDWFKLRLNQVEMERAMLMQDRIGVKITVPQFVPATENPDEALNKVVDLTTVGGDAADDTDADPSQNFGIDYTNLPGYQGTRRGLNG